MANLNIGRAPSGNAVLPFYATGALAFFALCLLMLGSPESLLMHYFNPHLLTMVHTAALGWATMVIFGAAHQLLPVICERDLYSEKMAALCWYTLTLGVTLLAFSFWNMRAGFIMLAGGGLIVFSVLLFVCNVGFTARIRQQYTIQKLFILSSSVWLLFTVTLGLLLASNLAYPVFSHYHLDILKLHAHAGLAGWFLLLIEGVSAKLVPMFLLGKPRDDRYLKYAYLLQNAGLITFLADAYFFGQTERYFFYLLLVSAGIFCWLYYLHGAYKSRIRKKTDMLMRHTFFSFLCLFLSLLLVPLLWYFSDPRWAALYGSLLFLGWISGIILGKSFKTLPFIVWNEHYKQLSGKVKVPLPKELYVEKLIPWQFACFVAALSMLAGGLVWANLILIRLALWLWLLVALLYNFNVFKTLLHKTKIKP